MSRRKLNNSMMSTGEEHLVSIPNDLIVEIFSRLPEKSVARCRCLSKLWGSILHRPYFTELFLTRSRSRPRLLFALKRDGAWSFYSLLQRPHDLVPYSDFHMKFPREIYPEYHGFTSGLIYLTTTEITLKNHVESVICNPRTGQYATLPRLIAHGKSFLGFDPIGKQYKVLFMDHTWYSTHRTDVHMILTLGNGVMEWRKIKGSSSLFQNVMDEGICIRGVLYLTPKRYINYQSDEKIVSFDVRSEEFESINVEWDRNRYVKLVNYKEKLGVITWMGMYELSISVLEDAEKQEWSKHVYTLPENNILDFYKYSIAGVTATGEIVFSKNYYSSSGPYYVVYFSLESNALQSVEVQGLEHAHRVCVYVDLVDDLNVIDAQYLKSSPRLNVITVRPEPEKLNSDPSEMNMQSTSLIMQNKQSTILLKNKYDVLANID